MSDSIEKAAEAFSQAISPPTKAQAKAENEGGEVERLFDVDHEGGLGGDGNEYGDEAEGVDEDAGSGDGSDFEGDEDSRKAAGESDEEGEGDDEGDDADDADDESGDGADTQQYAVLVDGEEVTVSLREALDGYIRQETFHRRLNKVHEAAQIVQRHAADADERFTKADQLLKEAEELWKAAMPEQEPDWDTLYAQDPQGARQLQKNWDAYKARVNEIAKRREAAQSEKSQQDMARLAEFAKAEQDKFVRMNPQWKQQADMVRDLSAMRQTASNVGFTDDEIKGVVDSRMLQILLKASKYDRMVASRPRPIKPVEKQQANRSIKGQNSGKGTSRDLPKGAKTAQQRLLRTGSVDDAAALFQRIITPR